VRLGRSIALAGTALLAGRLLDAAVLTPRRFRIREVPLAVPRWPRELDGLRVAVVGDVHAGAPWFDLARVADVACQVVAARPDLVFMMGDHLADVRFGTHLEPEPVAQALTGLQEAGVPVVGVLGNHDWYAGGERVRAALEATGLCVLEEQAVPVLDGRLWVAGVGDLWTRTPSVPDALAPVPDGAPVVLLTHNPDVVVDVPERVQLVLAGHTHGGQATAFGRPFHRISKLTANRWKSGWYAVERLYVTSGVGTSYLPLRTVVPEVPILVLGSA
jgi:predicted MPP superfamily phosphohydrolase